MCTAHDDIPELARLSRLRKSQINGLLARNMQRQRKAAKSIGWAIYAAGLVIWLFGYVTSGHASVFDWEMATPSWISSFVPNLEAELGLALMFASMIPIYWRAGWKRKRGA